MSIWKWFEYLKKFENHDNYIIRSYNQKQLPDVFTTNRGLRQEGGTISPSLFIIWMSLLEHVEWEVKIKTRTFIYEKGNIW